MTTLTPAPVAQRTTRWHHPLIIFSGLMAVTAIVSLAGLLLDDRTLTGDPIWLKPFKFSISLALYTLTWAWLLSTQRRHRRWMWWSATTVAVLLTVEMVIIIGQVIRGRISHFNAATELDTTTGGDLRIPHFVGIHALQALPLLAMLLTRASQHSRRLADTRIRTRLVLIAAGAYASLTALVTWQALRGQSLIDPDLWTLTALATILAATGLGARAALTTPPVRTDTS